MRLSTFTISLCILICAIMLITPASARLLPSAHRQAARHPRAPVAANPETAAAATTDPLASVVGHAAATPTHAQASPSAANFAQDAEAACKSCCDGGSCSYLANASPAGVGVGAMAPRPRSVLRTVQCCGKLQNQPFCCAASSLPRPSMIAGATATAEKCSASDSGVYTCVSNRAVPHYLFAEVSYLSPAGLIVIVLLGSMFLCCYFSLAARRTHSAYNGQPYYAGHQGGSGAGGLCASCLAGFCCFELCCTGNLNF